MATKPTKDGMAAKGNVQNFNGCGQHIITPSHADMPMHAPQSFQMAMNNTFEGMPAYPNQYVFEGHTNKPFRAGDLKDMMGERYENEENKS